jgi:hypothetical protein
MPFRYWVIVVAFAAFIFSASSGHSESAAENEQIQEEQVNEIEIINEADDRDYLDLLAVLEDIEAAILDQISDRDEIERQQLLDTEKRNLVAQETMALWAEWMFYAASASVVLSFAALYAIARTLHHTRRAADYTHDMLVEARRATSAVNRAWIKVSPSEGSYYLDKEGGITFNVDFEIQNVGNTPAMSAHTEIDAVPDYDHARDDAARLAKRQIDSKFEKTASRIVFANENYTRPWSPSINGVVFSERGYITAAIIGCVSYRTSYDDDLHQTVFAFGVSFEGGDISPRSDSGHCDFFVLPGGFAT